MQFHTTAFGFLRYCLALNQKDLKKICKHYGLKINYFSGFPSAASVTFLENEYGVKNLAVVRISENTEYSLAEHLAWLAHEAVHIKQQACENIGEDMPSMEFEAYFVEDVAKSLITDFLAKSKIFEIKP